MTPGGLEKFDERQIDQVNNCVSLAEELVSEHYKMSANQWLRKRYDVNTLEHLEEDEVVHGPFAQIVRYEAKRKESVLETSTYDFYKVCLQDHSILGALGKNPSMELFPFCLYIVTHELIHIVRFGTFMQSFSASAREKLEEEKRVHALTYEILAPVCLDGLAQVFDYYASWRTDEAPEMPA